MKQLLIVFLGGGAGTVIRFLIGKLLPYSGKGFPWSTFYATRTIIHLGSTYENRSTRPVGDNPPDKPY